MPDWPSLTLATQSKPTNQTTAATPSLQTTTSPVLPLSPLNPPTEAPQSSKRSLWMCQSMKAQCQARLVPTHLAPPPSLWPGQGTSLMEVSFPTTGMAIWTLNKVLKPRCWLQTSSSFTSIPSSDNPPLSHNSGHLTPAQMLWLPLLHHRHSRYPPLPLRPLT